ncbi:FUSC family protein [Leucobacter massiliensis]|uniref:Integral membrane bound transporter domain-containing protein n=1 Tax=Leucobacter massiliensis TaxID=1686285 RepID=A0A2S9QR31_9MICO|nr:FUSC family protein [Leucobacter massiliensis]PRI12041.1 hypothetical protein B4915_02960 [Leucobacter massiliensis]
MTDTSPSIIAPRPRHLLRLAPGQGEHWVALRALLSVGAPLMLLWGIGRLELAPFAVFPAFATVFGRRYGHRHRLRVQGVVALAQLLSVLLGALVPVLGGGPWVAVGAAVLLVAVASLVGDLTGWTPVGPMFQLFAFVSLASAPVTAEGLTAGALVAAASAAWAMVLGGVWALGRRVARARGVMEPERPAPPARRPPGSLWADAGMYAVATAIAGAVPTLLGIGHVGWAMVAAVAGLAAPNAFNRVLRATHRTLGTLAGIPLAILVLAVRPGELGTVLLIILLTGAIELVVTRNYALALVPITPLVVLMGRLNAPGLPAGELILDRLAETLIGAATAILVALALALASAPRRTPSLTVHSRTR